MAGKDRVVRDEWYTGEAARFEKLSLLSSAGTTSQARVTRSLDIQ